MTSIDLGSDPATGVPVSIEAGIFSDGCLIVGARGAGKTSLSQALLERTPQAGLPVVAFDTTGDLSNGFISDLGLQLHRSVPTEPPTEEPALISLDVDAAHEMFDRPASMDHSPSGAADELRDLVAAFLGLLGFRVRVHGPEFALIETLVHQRWMAGHGISMRDLATLIIEPPIARIGAFDVDTVISPSRREDLAGSIVDVLRSPGFSSHSSASLGDLVARIGSADPSTATVISFAQRSERVRRFLAAVVVAKLKTAGHRILLHVDEATSLIGRGDRSVVSRLIREFLYNVGGPGVAPVLVAEDPAELHEDVEDLCRTWIVGRLPVASARRNVVDDLDLVNPPVDEIALDAELKQLEPGHFILRSSRLDRLVRFRLED